MARLILFVLSLGMLSLLATPPVFAQATNSVKCGDDVVTVSVKGGKCTRTGKVIVCSSAGEDNWVAGGCGKDGKAGCSANVYGNGSCTIKREKPSKGGATTLPGSITEP
jgi:hypothetical protein